MVTDWKREERTIGISLHLLKRIGLTMLKKISPKFVIIRNNRLTTQSALSLCV